MQRLVAVRLRLGDVVLDALLHRRPLIVHDAECVITIRNAVDQNADREKIIDLVVRSLPLLHLLENRPEMLRPTGRVDVLDAGAGERVLQRVAHLLDQRFALATLLRNFLGQRAILLRLEMLERQVLELPSHLRHTEAMSERRVQIASLLGDAAPLFFGQIIERPHVVQAIGELDDDHPRVFGDRQKQFAIALDLPLLRRAARGKLGDLR